jgi:hypothetical protein
MITRAVLVFLGLLSGKAYADSTCLKEGLPVDARLGFEAAARNLAPPALDYRSLESCVTEKIRFASIDTLPLYSPDGTEFWTAIECWTGKREVAGWTCRAEAIRGFRFVRASDSRAIKVALSPGADSKFARKWVPKVMALMESGGEASACDTSGSPMALRELLSDLDDGTGVYRFEKFAGPFKLGRGLLDVTVNTPLDPDGAPLIYCWWREYVVVTG